MARTATAAAGTAAVTVKLKVAPVVRVGTGAWRGVLPPSAAFSQPNVPITLAFILTRTSLLLFTQHNTRARSAHFLLLVHTTQLSPIALKTQIRHSQAPQSNRQPPCLSEKSLPSTTRPTSTPRRSPARAVPSSPDQSYRQFVSWLLFP